MALHCNNSSHGSHINRNVINEAQGPALVAESNMQNVKELVVKDFNEKCDEYFRELFHNVDVDNWEITESLIAEYNVRVRNLLLEIQIMVSDFAAVIWSTMM